MGLVSPLCPAYNQVTPVIMLWVQCRPCNAFLRAMRAARLLAIDSLGFPGPELLVSEGLWDDSCKLVRVGSSHGEPEDLSSILAVQILWPFVLLCTCFRAH